MKIIFFSVFLLLTLPVFAQNSSYADWKKKAQSEINLKPEYGGVKKTPEEKRVDDEFVKNALEQDTTLKKASNHLVQLGFVYLYRGDLETAMKRFNQAWLLDSKNEDAYWGFGSIYFLFNDMAEALKQYDKGLTMNPASSNILTDKATIYMSLFMKDNNTQNLDKAIGLFLKSYSVNNKNQNTSFKLSVAYFYKRDCTNAQKYYNECMKLGGKPITIEYTNALNKLCAN